MSNTRLYGYKLGDSDDALTIATLSWLVSPSLVGKLQRVQNCAARFVVRAPPHVHITPVLRHLHWLPVRARISYKIACLCFNTITSSTPADLTDPLHLYCLSRSLRSSADTRLLKIPLFKCKTKGDLAFSYFGLSVWNSLPLHTTFTFIFYSCIVPMRFLSWEIRVAFPGESQLR